MWKYDIFSDVKIFMNVKRRWIIVFWTFNSINLFIYTEIMERHFDQKLRFYNGRSRCIMTGRDFIMIGQDILWQVEILLWRVKIFVMTDQDLHVGRSNFSWWQVQIFMMTGQDFFSWWQLEIFIIAGQDFVMNGRDLNLVVFWMVDNISSEFFFVILFSSTKFTLYIYIKLKVKLYKIAI